MQPHFFQDQQSLRMHQEAVRMLQAEPTLSRQALDILERWDTHVCSRSKPLRDRWVQIISEQDWTAALEESERGNQLRQASPLAILLPEHVRLEIIRSIREEKDAASCDKLVYMNTDNVDKHKNNERLRQLVKDAGLTQPVSLTIFNRGLGPAAYSESAWKAFFCSPETTRFRPLSDDLLAHAEKVFGKVKK